MDGYNKVTYKLSMPLTQEATQAAPSDSTPSNQAAPTLVNQVAPCDSAPSSYATPTPPNQATPIDFAPQSQPLPKNKIKT